VHTFSSGTGLDEPGTPKELWANPQADSAAIAYTREVLEEASELEAPTGMKALQATTLPEGQEEISFLPPNLTWLEKPTPFGSNLRVMVNELRTAKQQLNFTLEQILLRARKLQKELDDEQFHAEEVREELRSVDASIAACALVAEQSATIRPELLTIPHTTPKPNGNADPAPKKLGRYSGDPTICKIEDIRQFFLANPQANWTAKEIRESLPAEKRLHAKTYIPTTLAKMVLDGELQRITSGVFRWVPVQ
jgi:hypothetical protein